MTLSAPATPPSPRSARVGVPTLLAFLVGRRGAIERVAGSPAALWVGLVFVLSAAFARDYDQADLLREPWHLGVPAAASVAMSLVLYAVFWVAAKPEPRGPFVAGYRAFLAPFWLTAPMAWLYAIPYERMLPPGEAVAANLNTLAFVAAWRVALMARVISVLTARPFLPVLAVVLAVSDVAVQVALSVLPLPLLDLMGGVRLADGDRVLANASAALRVFGFLGLFVLIPAGLTCLGLYRGGSPFAQPASTGGQVSRPLVALAVLSVVAWAAVLPRTQPEQQRRTAVERQMKAGQIAAGIDGMSALPREAFPPLWTPPPRIGYADESPPLPDVMEVLADGRGSPWVRAAYVDKFERAYLNRYSYFHRETDVQRVLSLLDRLPEGPAIKARNPTGVQMLESRDDPTSRPATTRAATGATTRAEP